MIYNDTNTTNTLEATGIVLWLFDVGCAEVFNDGISAIDADQSVESTKNRDRRSDLAKPS